jgi:hypothetical protein
MDRTRLTALLLVAACFGVALAAGPYGADIRSLAADSGDAEGEYATGAMDATILDTPEEARLDRFTENGTDRYRLLVPAAGVGVANVSGRPVVTYKLRIEGVGHTRGTAHVLSEAQEGRFRTTIEPSTLAADRVGNDSYVGELSLVVRSDRGARRIHRSNVTVRVTD